MTCVTVLALSVLLAVVAFSPGQTGFLVGGSLMGLVVAVGAMLDVLVLDEREKRRVRAAGYRVCSRCGYDLSTSELSGLCPECAFEYDVVSLEEAWERAWSPGEDVLPGGPAGADSGRRRGP